MLVLVFELYLLIINQQHFVNMQHVFETCKYISIEKEAVAIISERPLRTLAAGA